ncbi:MAG TPA: EF-P lysine aminoacylase EpmA [Gammaproteobacteria bacterium]|nr:EF-P lysine aminoacylase EpmA [Gammaproteobacteria bacterium]
MSYERGASLETLRQRAAMLAAVRAFFAARGVLEVETPALSSAGVTDPAIESIVAKARSLGTAPQFLQTSPEFAMKRLLAAGSGDIFQLCRVFRDDELGRWHQPEFTLLEWYRVGWDEQRLMTEVAELIESALTAAAPGAASAPRRLVRLTYAQALVAAVGAPPDAPTAELVRRLEKHGVDVPRNLRHDAVLDLAFGTAVLASFDGNEVTFVYDYPASQAALARMKPTTPPVAARFEAFCGGIELANGFHELNDASEQRRRFVDDVETRRAGGRNAPPLDEQLLRALPSLPDCAGVALGFDRLVALATGHGELKGVLAFAHGKD